MGMYQRIGEYVLYVIMFIFTMAGIASHEWSEHDAPHTDKKREIGPFRQCFDGDCDDTLDISEIDNDAVRSTRAFLIFALLFIVAGIIAMILADFDILAPKNVQKPLFFNPMVIIFCLFLAGLSWFSVHDDLDDHYTNVSTGAGWVLTFLAILAAVGVSMLPHEPVYWKDRCGGKPSRVEGEQPPIDDGGDFQSV